MNGFRWMILCMVLFGGIAAADQVSDQAGSAEPTDPAQRQAEPDRQSPTTVEQPMKINEPMQGGMMKPGMMKKDMKQSAEQKEKVMEQGLKQEERSMP